MWTVHVGGSKRARLASPPRCYKTLRSATRRMKEIAAKRDLGIETIWIVPELEKESWS